MFKKSLMAAAVAASLGLGAVGAAQADAVAQSLLRIEDFTITPSNPGAIVLPINGSNQATVSLTYNAVNYPPTYLPGAGIAPFTIPGPDAPVSGQANTAASPYVPFTELPPASGATGNFGNATSTLTGGALTGGADARTDATLSVVGAGSGTASSTLGVTADFTITTSAATAFTFNFLADPYLRAYVDPLFSAQAGLAFSIVITQNDVAVFSWAPDGVTGNATGGNDSLDPCSLNAGRGQNAAGENVYLGCPGGLSGAFQATTNVLNAGTYEFRVSHFSNASLVSGVLQVPEPSSLLLAGLAIFGAGVVGRRRFGR